MVRAARYFFIVLAITASCGCGGRVSEGDEATPASADAALDAPNGVAVAPPKPRTCPSQPCLLATERGYPDWIAVDDTAVYWSDSRRGRIVKASLGGGAPEPLVSGRGQFWGIAVDATSVYWTESTVQYQDAVAKVAKEGGAVVTLAWGHVLLGALAVDADSLFWTDGKDLLTMPIGGGSPATLATGADFFTMTATSVFYASGNHVLAIPKSGGAAVTLASGQAPSQLAADATSVYWTTIADGATNAIVKVAQAGGASVTLATVSAPGYAEAMAVDAKDVYWTNGRGGGTVAAVPLGGGSVVTLANAGNDTISGAIVAYRGNLYWTVDHLSDHSVDERGAVWWLTP